MRRKLFAIPVIMGMLLLANACGSTAPAVSETAAPGASEASRTASGETSASADKSALTDAAQETAAAEEAAAEEKRTAAAEETAEEAYTPAQFDFDAWYADLYRQYDSSFENQEMPDAEFIPWVPWTDYPPEEPYESVTAENLQGRWVNRYKEGGVQFEEVLTVNGDRASIETFQDGVKKGVWNGDGYFSIEDRSARNLCPAFRINDEEGRNLCTIYIRWVKDNAFYDGGFLNEWKREETEDIRDQYLYDTVTLENLQGIWYTDYAESGSYYQVILKVDGSDSFIFETKDGEPQSYWNGKGEASLVLQEFRRGLHWPELLLNELSGQNLCGIYISRVDEASFYDVGLHNWYIRITEDRLREMGLYPADYNVTWLPDGGASIVNEYTVTVRPAENAVIGGDGECRRWNVTVEGEGGVKGEFKAEVPEDSPYAPDASGVVYEEDVNLDGLMDLVVFAGILDARGTASYACYLREGKGFVRCSGYEDIPDPFVDEETGHIWGILRDGADAYYELEYEMKDHEVKQVSERHYVYDEAQGEYVEQ